MDCFCFDFRFEHGTMNTWCTIVRIEDTTVLGITCYVDEICPSVAFAFSVNAVCCIGSSRTLLPVKGAWHDWWKHFSWSVIVKDLRKKLQNSSNLRSVIMLIPPSHSPPHLRFRCAITMLLKVLCAISEYLNCAWPVLAGVNTDRSGHIGLGHAMLCVSWILQFRFVNHNATGAANCPADSYC